MINVNVKNYLDITIGNQQPSSFRNGGEGSTTRESTLSGCNIHMRNPIGPTGPKRKGIVLCAVYDIVWSHMRV